MATADADLRRCCDDFLEFVLLPTVLVSFLKTSAAVVVVVVEVRARRVVVLLQLLLLEWTAPLTTPLAEIDFLFDSGCDDD